MLRCRNVELSVGERTSKEEIACCDEFIWGLINVLEGGLSLVEGGDGGKTA